MWAGGLLLSQLSLAVEHQCKPIWQDSWFVQKDTQQVQLLGWNEGFGNTRGLFFYRSHEVIFLEQEGDKFYEYKIYLDGESAPRNISGIALDNDKLFLAFHNSGGTGSWLKSFDWKKIHEKLKSSDNRLMFIGEDNEKDYLIKDFPNVGRAADGIGHIYIDFIRHNVYGQYGTAGRKVYEWSEAGEGLGWVSGSNNFYRENVLAINSEGHLVGIEDYGNGKRRQLEFEGIYVHNIPSIFSSNIDVQDLIPIAVRGFGSLGYPTLYARAMYVATDQIRYMVDYPSIVFKTDMIDVFVGAAVRVAGVVQGSPEDRNHVYILKTYFDSSVADRSESKRMALFQCDYDGE